MNYKVKVLSSVGETTTWTDSVNIITGIMDTYLEMIGNYEDGYVNVRFFNSDGEKVGWIDYYYTSEQCKYETYSSDGEREEFYRLFPVQEWTAYRTQQIMHE